MWTKEIRSIMGIASMRQTIPSSDAHRLVLEEWLRLTSAGHNLRTKKGKELWAESVRRRVTEQYLGGFWFDADQVDKLHYFETGEIKPKLQRVK